MFIKTGNSKCPLKRTMTNSCRSPILMNIQPILTTFSLFQPPQHSLFHSVVWEHTYNEWLFTLHTFRHVPRNTVSHVENKCMYMRGWLCAFFDLFPFISNPGKDPVFKFKPSRIEAEFRVFVTIFLEIILTNEQNRVFVRFSNFCSLSINFVRKRIWEQTE